MHNPFKSLEKDPSLRSSLKKRAKGGPAAGSSPASAAAPAAGTVSEEDLFRHAFSDVEPLTKSGRDVAARVPTPAAAPPPPPTFARLLEENIEFEMEYSHEFITGQVRGLDAKIFRKLRTGEYSVQGHLDLHGMNADQAKIAVIDFLRRSYMEGKRCVLLIPGRGKNSPFGQGVLRQELTSWLTQAPLKRIVLAFTTALPKHGGSGAVYLLMRQVRKDRGKIAWEDVFADLDG
jgi:DNA-nicking Smr family endonuclease